MNDTAWVEEKVEFWKALALKRNEQISAIAVAMGIEQKVGRQIDDLVVEMVEKLKEGGNG